MAKTKISEFSANPANNTDIDNINIAEGCAPSGINDAIRELMAQLKDFQVGSAGDSFNGPVGTTTAAAGAFTTLSATGVTTVQAGTNSAPAITTSGDTNTGIFFPAADTIAFSTAGTEDARFDASGNLMIGTTTQISKLTVNGGIALSGGAGASGFAFYPYYNSATSYNAISANNNGDLTFITGVTAPAIRACVDTSGNLLVGAIGSYPYSTSNSISTIAADGTTISLQATAAGGPSFRLWAPGSSQLYFDNTGTGTYVFSKQNGSSYATVSAVINNVSDRRLKENIRPLAGALDRVLSLKPVVYSFKSDVTPAMPWGTDLVDGFLADEFGDVIPGGTYGEKDAVNEDGSIKPQQIDLTRAIPLLTAAIQEQQAIIKQLKADVDALKAAQPE